MNDDFNIDDLSVHWVGDIPVADLSAKIAPMLSSEDWLMLDDVIDVMRFMAKRLCSLRGSTMSGQLFPLVNRSLSQIAAAELPTKQRSLGLSQKPRKGEFKDAEESTESSEDYDCLNHTDEFSHARAGAIHAAESILKAVTSRECVSAEHFLAAISASPDPEITRNALKLAGEGGAIHGDVVSYHPGSFATFPRTLETSGKYRMRLKNFGDVRLNEVVGDFEWCHVEGRIDDAAVGALLKHKQRVPIYFSSSRDALLFRIGAAAGLVLDADVSITIPTFSSDVDRFTVSVLADREMSLQQLQQVVTQLRLPLDALTRTESESE